MNKCYQQVAEDRRKIIMEKYEQFQQKLDYDDEPIKVFDPLPPHLLKELDMIREASKGLQLKKEEDVSKAAQAEEQAALEAKKKAEEEAAQEAAQEKEAEKEA